MKKVITQFVIVAAILAMPGLLPAQSQSSGDVPQRIAVINIQQAIGSTGEGKKAIADLDKKYDPRRQSLQDQQKEISSLQDRLQNQSSMLSDDEKYQLTHELDQKQRHFKEDQEDAQDDYQADTQAAVRDIGQKMIKLIGQYAQQHHFSLVIGDQQIPVYYASKTVDITQDIINLYNKTYAAPAASAASSSSTSAPHSNIAKRK